MTKQLVISMSKDKEATLRRVYVLPQELVDRIVQFQKEKGYPSEVEAVRKLLDEALLYRDSPDTIIKRFTSRLTTLKMPSEVSKDVLVGHPLVTKISFLSNAVQFKVSSGEEYRIYDTGKVQYYNSFAETWTDYDDFPF
ncbi:hypothetical protein C7374_11180 [Falsochrobactrum ovis]|uniref:Uncharacterized protein n=2 Tax=Falsochrobactrum ovis TaxID=1293442 RepID=A0A364JTH7_9HYPH|nr:hypothetical protein C7374_11180 [Falsochrobactrum ovis]